MKNKKRRVSLLLLMTVLLLCAGCSVPAITKESGQEFSFIYMGDSQADPQTGDYTVWGKMLKLAAEHKSHPSFVMIGGDLINDGNDKEEWDSFFIAGGEALKKLDLYPAVGNHDNTDLFKTMFDLPDNGPEDKKEAFYSFDYGNTHFTVMDSNAMGAANQDDIDWLKKDLAETNKTYKIVMFHHPAYPAVEIPKDNVRAETIRRAFVPVMEKAGVDLVLSGHQHVYMRSYPILNGKKDENGIVYLMGASGGKQYTPHNYDYIAFSIGNQPVYSIITVNQEGIFIETRDAAGKVLDSTRPAISREQQKLTITVKGDGINGEKRFTLGELANLPNSGFQHVYSTINNWPTSRFYAARGISVRSILKEAGVLDKAQVITFRSPDSYKISFTREQLLDLNRYYYPKVKDGISDMAEPVEPIIAYEYKEGSDNMEAAEPDKLCLIIGQNNPWEHTNPAFIVNVSEIIVSNKEASAWEPASTFPQEGKIAAGELVKLQHKYMGQVKLHYTMDGSEPTELSPMYNVSTYQPQLNVPIPITRDVVIKVMATGYGKKNSEITSFTFDVQ